MAAGWSGLGAARRVRREVRRGEAGQGGDWQEGLLTGLFIQETTIFSTTSGQSETTSLIIILKARPKGT